MLADAGATYSGPDDTAPRVAYPTTPCTVRVPSLPALALTGTNAGPDAVNAFISRMLAVLEPTLGG